MSIVRTAHIFNTMHSTEHSNLQEVTTS